MQNGSGPATVANGTVFSQNPPANGTAAKGATVTIFVQTGRLRPRRRPTSGSPSRDPQRPAGDGGPEGGPADAGRLDRQVTEAGDADRQQRQRSH